MSARYRIAALAGVVVLALLIATGYVLRVRADQRSAGAPASGAAPSGSGRHSSSGSIAAVSAVPHIVFRNTALGSGYGRVAMVTAADPGGARAITQTLCDRVDATRRETVCLATHAGVLTTYSAQILDPGLSPLRTLPLAGIPSRARLSSDGRYAATTTFVAGDSYAGTSFSTRTTVSTVSTGSSLSLETFALIHRGHRIAPIDRNLWGVTFAADDDTFYATAAWGGHTWLVRGSLRARTLTTLHEDAECPSLSPDGRIIVFKQRGSLPPGRWRLAAYTIATGAVVPLAETRSVDDQVAWRDNQHVMYGLPRSGSQAAVDDVWQVPADGRGRPTLLIAQAWSPALVGGSSHS